MGVSRKGGGGASALTESLNPHCGDVAHAQETRNAWRRRHLSIQCYQATAEPGEFEIGRWRRVM
jgi:hypothetical protein